MMYLYPDHLKAKAVMWLWQLRNVAVLGIGFLFSTLLLSQFGIYLPFVMTAVYAFLTIQVEDISILAFIKYAGAYFLWKQQYFEWRQQ